MVMTQQQKAAFNQQYIHNQNVGWRDRYVHEGGNVHHLQSQEGINAFDQNFIYNPEVGWRERTLSQKVERTAGKVLTTIGEPFVDTNQNLSFENEFDRNYIYNSQVGWRERTEAERASENLDRRFGPGLQAVGDGLEWAGRILVHKVLVPVVDVAPSVLKFLAIGVAAGAAGLVAFNGIQVVVRQVEGV